MNVKERDASSESEECKCLTKCKKAPDFAMILTFSGESRQRYAKITVVCKRTVALKKENT